MVRQISYFSPPVPKKFTRTDAEGNIIEGPRPAVIPQPPDPALTKPCHRAAFIGDEANRETGSIVQFHGDSEQDLDQQIAQAQVDWARSQAEAIAAQTKRTKAALAAERERLRLEALGDPDKLQELAIQEAKDTVDDWVLSHPEFPRNEHNRILMTNLAAKYGGFSVQIIDRCYAVSFR